jgi:PAS domain S-box-containing protein
LDNYILVLYSVENLYASSISINRQQFKTFVSHWFSRHPGIRAVSWSVLAGGLCFTGLLGGFLLTLTGHGAKLQAINTDLEKEITERKRAQDTVTQLAAIVESSDDAIIGTTLEGVITSWNKGAEILYGYSAEEIKGRPISILIPSDRPDEPARLRERIKQGEHVAQYETVRVRKGGVQVHVSLTLSPMKDATGKITAVATIAHDYYRAQASGI